MDWIAACCTLNQVLRSMSCTQDSNNVCRLNSAYIELEAPGKVLHGLSAAKFEMQLKLDVVAAAAFIKSLLSWFHTEKFGSSK